MPYLIPRQKAIDEINSTLKKGKCLACWILKSNAKYVLHKGKHITVALSEYPRTWGQIMVILNSHKISVSETTTEEWDELSEYTRIATIAIEKVLNPLRCYIASLGATENLPNTCPHLHFNILPIYNVDDTPSSIFTWQNGLYAADDIEWNSLSSELKIVFNQVLNQ